LNEGDNGFFVQKSLVIIITMIKLTEYSHGQGCGCKISPKVLDTILASSIEEISDPNLLVGNHSRDDAAVYDLGNGEAIISTTDFFMPIVCAVVKIPIPKGLVRYILSPTLAVEFSFGHLSEVCLGSGVSATINYNKVPILPNIKNYLANGCSPGGAQRNFDSYGHTNIIKLAHGVNSAFFVFRCDFLLFLCGG
jgi:selenophosphate synthase